MKCYLALLKSEKQLWARIKTCCHLTLNNDNPIKRNKEYIKRETFFLHSSLRLESKQIIQSVSNILFLTTSISCYLLTGFPAKL